MLHDPKQLDRFTEPVDVLICGGGTVGLFLGVLLARGGRQVMVLERGDGVALPDGEEDAAHSVGRPHFGHRHGPAFGLGGTSALWGGQLAEFDAEDFADWPLDYADIAPSYAQVYRHLGPGKPGALDVMRERVGGEAPQANAAIERFFVSHVEPRQCNCHRSRPCDATRRSTDGEYPMTTVNGLGLGCARLVGGREARSSRQLVEVALELGIRHFDTAPYYGDGWSEHVLGDVLHSVEGVTVTTKIGISRPPAPIVVGRAHHCYRKVVKPILARFPAANALLLAAMKRRKLQAASPPPARPFPVDTLDAEVEASLRALRRDRVDRFLVHEPDQFSDLKGEVAARFERLRAQGLIGEFGLGYDREVAEPQGFGTVLQSRYLPQARRDDTGVVRVFHGVLRHRGPGVSAHERLRAVLAAEPDARILLSVSTVQQLRQLHAATAEV